MKYIKYIIEYRYLVKTIITRGERCSLERYSSI